MNYNQILSTKIISIKDDNELIIESLTSPTDNEQELIERKQRELNEVIKKLKSHHLNKFFVEEDVKLDGHDLRDYGIQLAYLVRYLKHKLELSENLNIKVEM